MLMIRIRSLMWFSAGLVLALGVLATSLAWQAFAAGPSAPSSIIAIDPVRVLDTRDPLNVGLPGPFVSPVSQKLQITGSVPTTTGTKVAVPTGATAVLLNVTAVLPTANGFVSIRPGDAVGAPSTSSLNFTAGTVVPNSVQVAVPTTGPNAGQIDITYDALGTPGPTTDLLIDVVGYTAPLTNSIPIAASAREGDVGTLADNNGSIALSVTIDAPTAGLLQIVGSALIDSPVAAGRYQCDLSLGAGNTSVSGELVDTDRSMTLGADEAGLCTTNGATSVSAGPQVVNLVLRAPAAAGSAYDDATLDVLFVPGGSLAASLAVDATSSDDD